MLHEGNAVRDFYARPSARPPARPLVARPRVARRLLIRY